jgi:hypothetical protein
MLEELVALAMVADRRRKLDSVILVRPIGPHSPIPGRRTPLAQRLALWLQPREWAAAIPHEVRLEAEAWRMQ